MRNAALPLKYLFVSTLVALFASCSVFDTLSAYFNTYYNARRVFDEAEAEIWQLPEFKDKGRNLLVIFNPQQGTRTKFTSVIEKCSKLLQYHPESNLVDDALFMVGMSYFYQNEFQKAERKFKELMDGYSSSNLEPDARLMLAISFFKANDRTSATLVALQVVDLAGKAGEDRLVAGASMVLGEIELEAKNYTQARKYFLEAGDLGETSEKRSQAYFKVAEMYALEQDYKEAESAYRKAGNLSNVYTGDFRGRFGSARMMARQGDYGDALDELFDLRDEVNFREFFGEIDVEIGHVYRDDGDLEKAIDQYRYVDTLAAYARTVPAADAQYALGQLYETRFTQYDSARVFYDRGRSAPPQAEVAPLLVRRADILGKFLGYRAEITKLDSIRQALLIARDSAAVARPVNAAARDTSARDTTGLARADSAGVQARADSASVRVPPPPASPPGLSLDTVNVRLAGRMDELAGIFYTGLGRPDSAQKWYRLLLADFPESRPAPRALYVLARIEAEDSTATPGAADSLYREIVRRFPSSPFADEARRLLGLPPVQKSDDPAELTYSNGVTLMQAGEHLAAIDTFRAVVSGHPTSPAASRALYAAGWIYENNMANPDSAASAYEQLVLLYPASVYALRAQPRVAEVQAVRKQALEKARADSIAAAATLAPPPSSDSTAAATTAPSSDSTAAAATAPAPAPAPAPVENKPAPATEEGRGEGRREKQPAPPPPDPNQKKVPENPDAEPPW